MSLSIFCKITLITSYILLVSGCGGGDRNNRDTSATANHSSALPPLSSSQNYAGSANSAESQNKNEGHSSLSNSSSVNLEKKLSQVLSFSEQSIHMGFASNTKESRIVINPVIAPGTGAITYKSNNPNIAYIDDKGQVHALPNPGGPAVITATIAADDKYLGASASYTLYPAIYAVDSYEDMCESPCRQQIVFAKSQIELKLHQLTINHVSRYGDGEINYSSGDSHIATIDKNGLITARGAGATTIKVDVAATRRFPAASAEYPVTVIENDLISLAPNDIPITAWIGSRDTRFSFPETANDFVFYSSSDQDCDFTHVLKCTNGQLDLLSSTTISTAATTLDNMGKHLLKDPFGHTSFRMVSAATFEPRIRHETVKFKDSLWLVGGQLESDNFFEPVFKNDIWSSTNGISWTEQSTNSGFSSRIGHKIVAFNERLWLIGGNDWKLDYLIPGEDNGRKNDIWSSNDGITWTQQLAHASFSPRSDHQVVVFNNQLWLIGGNDKTGDKNDIWSSSNGITWVEHTGDTDSPPASHFQAVVFNDKLWLIGNNGDDVWSSTDGIQWTHEALTSSFSPRENHKVVVHNSKLWLIGGYDKNDVWSSVDGLSWVEHTQHAAFSPRHDFQLSSFDGKLVISGGISKEGFSNEIWSSSDGIEWRKGFAGIVQFPQ
ncbi:MAG TPA: Ig-like domain-containing protein [Cellvibrio sp.]|nr:Ig-like domain-containing protein [Cellvibrio sp.]